MDSRVARPVATGRRLGHEEQPLVIVDDFAPDPDALRVAAGVAAFGAAGTHYPGVRAALPPDYLAGQLPLIARLVGRHVARCRRLHVIDASFSIVSTPPDALTAKQRLPHVDAFGPERIALVHYLSADGGGTAFYRHRATGFETLSQERAAAYNRAVETELQAAPPSAAYCDGNTVMFEQIEAVDARLNRALIYRSHNLHSGVIAADTRLSPDPAIGRLTITAFLTIE